jgi:hypothetical protein
MSMAEVIESIEKDMWRELESRSVPEEQLEMIDCTTLGEEPNSRQVVGITTNGRYETKKGVKYEINNGQIMVEHENGYYGCLYGRSSMTIFYKNREVIHTGKRSINTPDELYEELAVMPEFLRMLRGS